MNRSFFLSILFLLLAFGIQFLFAGSGIFVNVILATLITLASFFDLFELIVFILLAVFVINWQPAISWEVVLFAVLPIIAYGIRNISSWSAWALNLIFIFLGIIILYAVIAPARIVSNPSGLVIDLFGSMLLGQLIFFTLSHYAPQE
jgi:hypothetical protein